MTREDILRTIEEIVAYNEPYCTMQDIPASVIKEIVQALLPIHAVYGEGKQEVWRTYIKPICPISVSK